MLFYVGARSLMLGHYCDSAAVTRLIASGDYRVLRRLDLEDRVGIANDNAGDKLGVCIDVETTGTDVERDAIIELSLRRFRFDDAGNITKLDRAYGWLEDPGRPLDPFISSLTGLTDEVLRGAELDEEAATTLLRSAHVRVAFNAVFDRRFAERRLPEIVGLPWACAMREVDWRARGFDGSGRALGWLLAQCGHFCDRAHRAAVDVDATIAILEHRNANGEPALFELLETASQTTWRFAAVGANFNAKDLLKRRGYRWDPAESVWWREVSDGDRDAEDAWLAVNVYAAEHMPRMDRPHVREITWETRHG